MTGPRWYYTTDTTTDPAQLPPPGPGQLPAPGPDPTAATHRPRLVAALWWLLAAAAIAALWWALSRSNRPVVPDVDQVAVASLRGLR